MKIPSRHNWFIDESEINPNLQLSQLVQMYMGYMYDKTFMMFEYKNLPDGIVTKDIEKWVQWQGKAFWIKYNDRFYVLYGAFSDYVTWNQEPRYALIVNPALPHLKTSYAIDEEVVVIPNDSLYIGLQPLMLNNATQMAQADISLNFATFNTRFKSIFVADDDDTKDSINKVIDDIWNGRKPSAILTENLYKKSVEGIEYNRTLTNDITYLIELKQYIKANWYMDLGINANYNMKRETLNESEMQVNDDSLMPLIDNMLMVRKEAINKINNKWGLNISVEFSSAWKKIRKEIENSIKLEDAEIKYIKDGGNDADGKVEEDTESVSE